MALNTTDLFAQLQQTLKDAEGDVAKAGTGVKAAGTRVRKYMQDVKNIAGDIRKAVLESQKEVK